MMVSKSGRLGADICSTPLVRVLLLFLVVSFVGLGFNFCCTYLLHMLLQNPHLSMCGLFTVGQGRQCDLCLKDPAVSNILCKLRHIEVELSPISFGI